MFENNDIEILNEWKSKSENSDFYKKAIYVWTEHDVKKRNIAKENKINYLEIFSCDFDTCLNQMISNRVFAVKPNFLITVFTESELEILTEVLVPFDSFIDIV